MEGFWGSSASRSWESLDLLCFSNRPCANVFECRTPEMQTRKKQILKYITNVPSLVLLITKIVCLCLHHVDTVTILKKLVGTDCPNRCFKANWMKAWNICSIFMGLEGFHDHDVITSKLFPCSWPFEASGPQCMTLNIFKTCHLGYLNLKIYSLIKVCRVIYYTDMEKSEKFW